MRQITSDCFTTWNVRVGSEFWPFIHIKQPLATHKVQPDLYISLVCGPADVGGTTALSASTFWSLFPTLWSPRRDHQESTFCFPQPACGSMFDTMLIWTIQTFEPSFKPGIICSCNTHVVRALFIQTSTRPAGDLPSAPSWFLPSLAPAICWNSAHTELDSAPSQTLPN